MRRLLLVAATGLVLAPPALADFVALPSPLAQLSPAPPLAGGATASAEGFRHRVTASTTVEVAIDTGGSPFGVRATQRLDVGVKGDYFFTIGAPLRGVEAAPGSASTPGFRATSIIWAGFNPGRRTLIARATLDAPAVASTLPLRVAFGDTTTTLANATGVDASAVRAEAAAAPLRRYLAQLRSAVRQGTVPASGGANASTKPVPTKMHVVVPLHVVGTVGARRVDTLLAGRVTIPARGAVRLRVTPELPVRLLDAPVAGLSGRALLDRATRVTLMVARLRQYQAFLGNPDPTGKSSTAYLYRTARRAAAPAPAIVHRTERNWGLTIATVAALIAALAAGAFAWSRS